MFKKNTAVTGFTFGMVNSTDGSAITTGTVTGYVTLDGGTQAAIAGTPAHEGNGQWSVNLTAAEMNGDIVGLTFVHASAIPVYFTIRTETKLVSELQDVTASAIADAVWDEATSGHSVAGSYGASIILIGVSRTYTNDNSGASESVTIS